MPLPTPPVSSCAIYQAVEACDAQALRRALLDNPQGVAGMEHPPYKHAIRALVAALGPRDPDNASDQAMMALFGVMHAHASSEQNTPKQLRLAAEMAVCRGLYRCGLFLLDQGATLGNDLGAGVLRMAWQDPDGALGPGRAGKWEGGKTFKRQHWEHQALCTLALAGANMSTLDAFRDGMRSPLDRKLLANAVFIALAGAGVLERMQGISRVLRATPQSVAWLGDLLGDKGLRPCLEQADPSKTDARANYLRAQLDAQDLMRDPLGAQPARRNGIRL